MSLYRIAPDGEGARLVACMPRTSDAYAVAVKAVTVRAIVCFVLTIASFVVSAVVGAFDATLEPGVRWLGSVLALLYASFAKLQIRFIN